MADFSAAPMDAYVWSQPDPVLRTARFSIEVEWTWPSQGYWSRFRLVRSIRSPCTRVEEGETVLEVKSGEEFGSYSRVTGRPMYRDGERVDIAQPMPGEWVYYTAFVLDANRVWKAAGSAYEISPLDNGWSTRLPELLPGASTAVDRGMMHPSDQLSDVVRFLQGPAAFLDMLVTKAEAAQYFWDPIKCPPQAVRHITTSWGYPYSNLLGLGRTRHVLAAMRMPSQGSVTSIWRIASASTGCSTWVEVSNNLMLDINDSSFENGTIASTRWAPQANLAIEDYANINSPVKVPPNVKVHYCLYVKAAGTYTCGGTNVMTNGIPIQDWTHLRMGCYAMDYPDTPTPLTSTISMGMNVYDKYGVYLTKFTAVPVTTLTSNWDAYGFSNPANLTDYGNRVPLTIGSQESMPSAALTNVSHWAPSADTGYANPQTVTPVAVTDGMKLGWASPPTNDGLVAFWGIPSTKFPVPIVLNAKYVVEISVTAAAGAAAWSASVASLLKTQPIIPTGDDTSISFEWTATTTAPSFGVEVVKPAAGWSAAGTHTVTSISVTRLNAEAVYGAPWFITTNPCYVDLIVVDDGR